MNIKTLREWCNKATPGPWVGALNAGFGVQFSQIIAIRGNHGDYIKEEDACFIAVARVMTPRVLSFVDAVTAAVQKLDLPPEHPLNQALADLEKDV